MGEDKDKGKGEKSGALLFPFLLALLWYLHALVTSRLPAFVVLSLAEFCR
jgi:hypothetical protein